MADYVLYGRKDSGSLAPELAFALAGVPVQLVDVGKTEDGGPVPELLAVNPRGQVPALVLPDGTAVTETVAIMAHVADAHPSAGLAPVPGTAARAVHDRWMSFLQANLYEGMLRIFYSDRYTTDPDGGGAVADAATVYVRQHFSLIEAHLPAGGFWLGARPTLPDLYLAMLVQWFDRDWLVTNTPRVAAIADRVAALPGAARVWARHYG
jgi:glutathione S-transferase